MKKLIVPVLVVLISMGITAGGGWYYVNHIQPPPAPDPTIEADGAADTAPTPVPQRAQPLVLDNPRSQAQIPITTTPRFVPGAEETSMLATQLDERGKQLDARAESLSQKEAVMNLILEDYRTEQEMVAKLRRAVEAELEQATRDVEQEVVSLDGEGGKAGAGGDGRRIAVGVNADEQANMKKIGLLYDNMPVDAAAKILVQMCEDGMSDVVAKLLAVMKDRQAGKVLAEIANTDADLGAQLTEELRILRKEAPPTVGQ
jgi:flagellar motility protein MotE (MotC chaperone)